jgi:hypothetical protein
MALTPACPSPCPPGESSTSSTSLSQRHQGRQATHPFQRSDHRHRLPGQSAASSFRRAGCFSGSAAIGDRHRGRQGQAAELHESIRREQRRRARDDQLTGRRPRLGDDRQCNEHTHPNCNTLIRGGRVRSIWPLSCLMMRGSLNSVRCAPFVPIRAQSSLVSSHSKTKGPSPSRSSGETAQAPAPRAGSRPAVRGGRSPRNAYSRPSSG